MQREDAYTEGGRLYRGRTAITPHALQRNDSRSLPESVFWNQTASSSMAFRRPSSQLITSCHYLPTYHDALKYTISNPFISNIINRNPFGSLFNHRNVFG